MEDPGLKINFAGNVKAVYVPANEVTQNHLRTEGSLLGRPAASCPTCLAYWSNYEDRQ